MIQSHLRGQRDMLLRDGEAQHPMAKQTKSRHST